MISFNTYFNQIHIFTLIAIGLQQGRGVVGLWTEEDVILSPGGNQMYKNVNESLAVTCSLSKTVKEIYWSLPNNQRLSTDKGRIHVEKNSLGLLLTFDRVERNDKGNYTCNAMSLEGNKFRKAFHLVPITPIVFVNTPDIQNATEFSKGILKCDALGDPTPNIFWRKNDTPIAKGGNIILLDSNKELIFTNVTLQDKGEYECRATQEFASMAIKKINFRILHKPKWKSTNLMEAESAYGYISGVVNLTCEAIAEPEPLFTWKRHNKVIRTNDINSVSIISESPHKSILQLPVHNSSIFGEYKCEASNSLGKLERIIILEEGFKPNPPKEFAVKSTTVHRALLEIPKENTNNGVIGYRVQFVIKLPGIQHNWRTPEYQDFMKETGNALEKSLLNIIDLLENTEYAVRVATRNAAGLSDYSPEQRFRTKSTVISDNSAASLVTGHHHLITMMVFIYFIYSIGRSEIVE